MSESLPGEETDVSTGNSDKEVTECPTCNRDDFASWRGVKLHHKMAHGESIAGVELVCNYCGEEYRERSCRSERSRFCSHECKNKWQAKSLKGEANPNYKERIKVECGWCGDEFERPQSQRGRAKYCSRECKDAAMSERTREDHPNWEKRIEKECEVCDCKFEVREKHSHAARFCSYGCYGEWIEESGSMSQENHPMWDPDRHDRYGPNWDEQKAKARERDGDECQYCGMPQDEHPIALHVHHIQPRSKFTDADGEYDYKEGNKLSNLVTVCRTCHRIVEKWQLKPDRR